MNECAAPIARAWHGARGSGDRRTWRHGGGHGHWAAATAAAVALAAALGGPGPADAQDDKPTSPMPSRPIPSW